MQTFSRKTGREALLAASLAALGLATTATTAQAAYEVTRLTQIADNGAASLPADFVEMNGQYFFAATTNETGRELWVSDGTADGTRLLRDILPGPYDSSPNGITVFDTPYGTRLVFEASGEDLSSDLWISDGTADGTTRITTTQDLRAIGTPVKAGDKLYFTAKDAEHGWELWVTQGTQATTRLVKDINPGTVSSSPYQLTAAVPADGTIYFRADDGSHGQELWVSDGTSAGTRMVEDIAPAASGYYHVSSLAPDGGGGIWFAANDGSNGRELWHSDGTAAGTAMVADILPGSSGSQPEYITPVPGGIVFAAGSANGFELWESNGSTTAELADINAGAGSSYPEHIVFWNNRLYFTAEDDTHGRELWSSTLDGAAVLEKDILPGSGDSAIYALKPTANHLWFSAQDGTHGRELWTVDTAGNTAMLADIAPGAATGVAASGFTPIASPDGVLFMADDKTHGGELWFSTGTSQGTQMIADIHTGSEHALPVGIAGLPAVNLDGKLLFPAKTEQSGMELWIHSDGQYRQLLDIKPGPAGSEPRELIRLGDHVYFSAETDTNGRELWRTDGTASGTVLFKEIRNTPLDYSSYPSGFVRLGDKLLFAASDNDDRELWISDGTTQGTYQLVDINAGIESSEPEELTLVGNKVAFQANDGATGAELWVTSGTAASTHRVSDIAVGSASAGIARLAVSDTRLFFLADDAVHGEELWTSDLTSAGTRLVQDINPGAGSYPYLLTPVSGGKLAFFADNGTPGSDPYITDGTGAGTTRIDDLAPGAGGVTGFDMHTFNGAVYMAVLGNDVSGGNLYRYDPADDTFAQVPGISPSLIGVGFRAMFTLQGNLFLPGTDSSLDIELWQTDGTAGGTMQTADLATGPRSSIPIPVLAENKTVYLAAQDESHGFEMWRMQYKAEDGGSGDGSGGDSGGDSNDGGSGTDTGSSGGSGTGSAGGGGGGGSTGLLGLLCLLLAVPLRHRKRAG